MTNSPPSSAVSKPGGAAELLRRRRARESLLAFTLYTKPDYEPNWHHRLICAYLERLASGATRRLMIFAPPRHGKTEVCSRRLPAYIFGHKPDAQVLAYSHTAGLASDVNRDVQRILRDPRYGRLFPGAVLPGKGIDAPPGPAPLCNSEAFELVGRGGSYRSAGVGTATVGRGFDYGLIDDPHAGREAADSPAQREAVWKWYTGDFYSRRAPGARILLIMTRWHPEDLAGRLLAQQEDDPRADRWEVVTLPAVAEGALHPADPRQLGEPLWPARYPLDDLEKTRAANPYDWYSQYQCRPRNPGSTEWPESYFDGPGFWFEEWPEHLLIRTMALDPSKGADAKTSDYQALIYYGRDAHGTEWVEADLARRPMTAATAPDGTELTEGMVENAVLGVQRFHPEGIGVETNQFQELLKVPFRSVAKTYGVEVPIYCINNVKPAKPVRIRRLGPPLSERKMRFRRTPGTRLLVEQLKQFPTADFDDGPDALEMARRLAIELWSGKPRNTR